MADSSSSLAKFSAALLKADPAKAYNVSAGGLIEVTPGGASLPLSTVVGLLESSTDSTAEWDFLTLTMPTDLAAGALFEIQFFGTQTQAAAANTLVFYAKVRGAAAVTIASVGAGSTAQNNRAMSGRALLSFPTAGETGSYMLGGDLAVNSVAAASSNSATARSADTRAGLTITIGLRGTASNAANINRVTAGFIKQLA